MVRSSTSLTSRSKAHKEFFMLRLIFATSLETLSERGRIVPELDDHSVREVFVYSYRLIYEVRGSEVRLVPCNH
jgi:hypothetical protein